MLQGSRGEDQIFEPDHKLYRRCDEEDIVGDRLNQHRIDYKNPSVNWSKYGPPEDVIFDFPDQGIAEFVVGELPGPYLPDPKPKGKKQSPGTPYKWEFHPHHKPCAEN